MHSGGSITGGSVQAKATNLLGREREIEELRVRVKELLKDLQTRREALEALEKERGLLKLSRGEAMGRVHQEEIAVAREQEREQNARQEWEAAKQRLTQTDSAREQLTESIAQIEEDLEAISRRTGDVETDQAAMQEKTQSLQDALLAARRQVESQRDRATQKMLAVTSREHELNSLMKDRQRLHEEKRQLKQSQDRVQRELNALKEASQKDEAAKRQLEEDVALRHQAVQTAQAGVDDLEQKRLSHQNALRGLRDDMEALQKEAAELTEKLHRAEVNRTKVEADLTAMQERIWNEYELTYGGAETYRAEKFDLSAGEKEASSLKDQIRAMGTVNVSAIEEYASVKERFDSLSVQQRDLKAAEEDLGELIGRLLVQMEQQFVSQFNLMKGFFRETFVRLFGGGHAELTLTDPNDALNCGIEVTAQPPGKKLQLLSLLSGGERALTAIAILFAMLKLKPTPFCILDEIEAALDEANINYFADYLAEYGKNTQFVVVTHRKGTMERCDALYGVAMEERGISKMVSVNLTEYAG
jgi:chromosome segregation protein